MATKTLKTVPKISVRIWRPIIEKLDAKLESACLRRDAYLSKVLETELNWLDHEVAIPNSDASYDYVVQRIDELDRKLVSLALPADLISRLNEICARKRIVRDAFFNRLFLLLAVRPKTLDRLFFSTVDRDWRNDVWKEYEHDGPFFENGFYPLEASINPFWAVRCGLQMYAKDSGLVDYVEPSSGKTIQVRKDTMGANELPDGIYTTFFDLKVEHRNLLGLNCYVPDWSIPGHKDQLTLNRKLDDLLAEL